MGEEDEGFQPSSFSEVSEANVTARLLIKCAAVVLITGIIVWGWVAVTKPFYETVIMAVLGTYVIPTAARKSIFGKIKIMASRIVRQVDEDAGIIGMPFTRKPRKKK